MAEKEKFRITFGLLLMYVFLSVTLGFIAGLNAAWAVEETNNLDRAMPDFSFWSRSNAVEFCKAHGYSGAWMECILDAGFTCSDSFGEYLRTKCFTIEDLYQWQYREMNE